MAGFISVSSIIWKLLSIPGAFTFLNLAAAGLPACLHAPLCFGRLPRAAAHKRSRSRRRRGENVIKLGDDSFWGWGMGTGNDSYFYDQILKNYNIDTHQNVSGPIPGFNGEDKFIDVAVMAAHLFELRNDRLPPSNCNK